MGPPNTNYPITLVHLSDGQFAVGSSGQVSSTCMDVAWIYDIGAGTYTTYAYPGSTFNTLYRIIKNSATDVYTIVGGCSFISTDSGSSSPSTTTALIFDMVSDSSGLTFISETIRNDTYDPPSHF